MNSFCCGVFLGIKFLYCEVFHNHYVTPQILGFIWSNSLVSPFIFEDTCSNYHCNPPDQSNDEATIFDGGICCGVNFHNMVVFRLRYALIHSLCTILYSELFVHVLINASTSSSIFLNCETYVYHSAILKQHTCSHISLFFFQKLVGILILVRILKMVVKKCLQATFWRECCLFLVL